MSRVNQNLRRRGDGLPAKAAYWVAYRLRIRVPRLAAAVTFQFPLKAISAEVPAARTSEQRIPALVHQTWMSNSFGRSHRSSLKRLQRMNPEYGFRLYVEEDIEQYMREHWSHHPVYTVFQRARFGPLKTDIWRYCLLYDAGGVYMDISKALSVPLRDVITQEDEMVVSYDKRSTFAPEDGEQLVDDVIAPGLAVSNWLLAAVPQHPLMLEVIDSIARNYESFRGTQFANPKEAILEFTGPRRLTHALHAHLRENPDSGVSQLDPDFGSTAIWEIPGSWVRYAARPAYILAARGAIVD